MIKNINENIIKLSSANNGTQNQFNILNKNNATTLNKNEIDLLIRKLNSNLKEIIENNNKENINKISESVKENLTNINFSKDFNGIDEKKIDGNSNAENFINIEKDNIHMKECKEEKSTDLNQQFNEMNNNISNVNNELKFIKSNVKEALDLIT